MIKKLLIKTVEILSVFHVAVIVYCLFEMRSIFSVPFIVYILFSAQVLLNVVRLPIVVFNKIVGTGIGPAIDIKMTLFILLTMLLIAALLSLVKRGICKKET